MKCDTFSVLGPQSEHEVVALPLLLVHELELPRHRDDAISWRGIDDPIRNYDILSIFEMFSDPVPDAKLRKGL